MPRAGDRPRSRRRCAASRSSARRDGVASTSDALVAGRNVVLNLWAYWCGPCADELPAMAEYQRRMGSAVTVLTVHQDENETAALLRLAELGVQLPTLQDGRRLVAAALKVPNVMPATVVLRSDGTVAEILPRSFTSADEIAAAVNPAMGVRGLISNGDGGPTAALDAAAAPSWLKPLLDNVADVPRAYRERVPADVLAAITVANAAATLTGAKRDAAVLVLFSGPFDSPSGGLPDDADLLVTVRASTLRHHAGQAAFPGGAADPGDGGPVGTALREAREETGIDTTRLQPLVTLDRMFIPPSGFHVVPVLAYSPDPGPGRRRRRERDGDRRPRSRPRLRQPREPADGVPQGEHPPVRRARVPAQPDAGLGFHRPGHLRDPRRRRLGAAVGHRRRARTGRGNGARRRRHRLP